MRQPRSQWDRVLAEARKRNALAPLLPSTHQGQHVGNMHQTLPALRLNSTENHMHMAHAAPDQA